MIELELPEPRLRDLTLPCVDPVRGRGPADGGPAPLAGRIKIGGPDGHKLTVEAVAADAELSAYVDQQSPFYEYYFVHLAVSFEPRPVSPRLKSVSVRLNLVSVPATPEPVALSMTPVVLSDKVSAQRTIQIGPKLKILGNEAELGEVTTVRSADRREPFLRGQGVDGSCPRWEFTRTSLVNLEGESHRLALVVRAGHGSATSISGQVTARTGNNIRWHFERELPDPLEFAAVVLRRLRVTGTLCYGDSSAWRS